MIRVTKSGSHPVERRGRNRYVDTVKNIDVEKRDTRCEKELRR